MAMRKYLLLAAAAAVLFAGGMAVNAQFYGPPMMGSYNDGYGPGWMMGNGWNQADGPGWMMMRGYGPGMMMGRRFYANEGNLNLSVDDVKTYMQRTIQNPNLKLGEVKEQNADTITADIVTKEKDVLVQRFVVNRHSGLFQPEQ